MAALERDGGNVRSVNYIAAVANQISCDLAAEEILSHTKAREFKGRLRHLEALAKEQGGYWGGRWSLNCIVGRLMLCIKLDDGVASHHALRELQESYYDWDVTNGWAAGARQAISELAGLVHARFHRTKHDLELGMGFLARAFMTRLGPRQRPEGIRDVGFALASAIREGGRPHLQETANLLDTLMHQTVDGTSELWPWRSE